jgi:hypothetical protein
MHVSRGEGQWRLAIRRYSCLAPSALAGSASVGEAKQHTTSGWGAGVKPKKQAVKSTVSWKAGAGLPQGASEGRRGSVALAKWHLLRVPCWRRPRRLLLLLLLLERVPLVSLVNAPVAKVKGPGASRSAVRRLRRRPGRAVAQVFGGGKAALPARTRAAVHRCA